MSTPTSTGRYAKGIAKRQQILAAVLAAYSSPGGSEPSFKEIAESVGLSEKGMNHYFGSKNELLVAVLEERDRVDALAYGAPLTLEKRARLIAAHNQETPRLLRLFLQMAAASSDPGHPAHDFFAARYIHLREQLEHWLIEANDADATTADWQARALIAASDGLQIQWLLDPSFDLQDAIIRLGRALTRAGH